MTYGCRTGASSSSPPITSRFVHKSTLSRRSEVFRDLFSLPDADTATTETIEGCPIVRISDASKDIRHLLSVLCCGKNYYYDGDTLIAVPFEILDSFIRMSHKYAVQDVLDHTLSRLKKYYTTDLAAWRDADSRARHVAANDRHAFKVVELARLTNTPSLLPTTFLACVELMTQYRVNPDGSFHYPAAALAVPDQVRAIMARGHLTQACATRGLVLLAAVLSPGCTARAEYMVAREAPLDALYLAGRRPAAGHGRECTAAHRGAACGAGRSGASSARAAGGRSRRPTPGR